MAEYQWYSAIIFFLPLEEIMELAYFEDIN